MSLRATIFMITDHLTDSGYLAQYIEVMSLFRNSVMSTQLVVGEQFLILLLPSWPNESILLAKDIADLANKTSIEAMSFC